MAATGVHIDYVFVLYSENKLGGVSGALEGLSAIALSSSRAAVFEGPKVRWRSHYYRKKMTRNSRICRACTTVNERPNTFCLPSPG